MVRLFRLFFLSFSIQTPCDTLFSTKLLMGASIEKKRKTIRAGVGSRFLNFLDPYQENQWIACSDWFSVFLYSNTLLGMIKKTNKKSGLILKLTKKDFYDMFIYKVYDIRVQWTHWGHLLCVHNKTNRTISTRGEMFVFNRIHSLEAPALCIPMDKIHIETYDMFTVLSISKQWTGAPMQKCLDVIENSWRGSTCSDNIFVIL